MIIILPGCKYETNSLGNPPVPLKSVTQDSKEALVTYEFELPEKWTCDALYNFSVVGHPEEVNTSGSEIENLPLKLGISNYYYAGLALTGEDKQMYNDLFAGNPTAYEDHLNKSNDLPSGNYDFKYKHYNGANGKVTEVQYTFDYNGKTIRIIRSYLESSPYFVSGAFDDSLEVSSGEIVPWVVESLKITEHFTLEENQIIKENL